MDKDSLKLIKSVPHHAGFTRNVEWHNMTFVTTRDLAVDSYILHYEWYTTRFNETVFQ